MATKDPYELLGVERNASDAEIKKAYRRLARKHHPDVNPGDTSAQKKFQEIASAYEILKDPARRARYDRTGSADEAPPPPSAASGSPFGGGGGVRWSADFGDLFSEIFSGASRAGFGAPEEEDDDVAVPLTIPFKDAVLGGPVTFKARIPRRCSRCGGSGRSGRNSCPACHGARFVVENEKLSVRIPAGVQSGSKIRVPGKGRSEGGDLYITLTVEAHPYFQRDGDDIQAEVPITVAEAYVGAEIEVPTIHGPVRARIPSGTAGGQRFRLRGRGILNGHTSITGDHYYRIAIVTPSHVTDEGREVAERFAKLYTEDPRARLPKGL